MDIRMLAWPTPRPHFQKVRDRVPAARGLMPALPIFFYTVSAHTKIKK